MSPQLEILLIACATAAACAIPGCFLVLRRLSLMSDAISHAILLGIVGGYLLAGRLDSPLLIIGAALTGVLTVGLTESLVQTRRVREDAAIGLVFPLLFSLAVILIARFADQVHLDTDAVLLGELAFAPFNRWQAGGLDLGPVSLWVMGGLLLLNLLLLFTFYKEAKLSTFDPALCAALGFSPLLLAYGLMSVVSLTSVGAFDAVGSILVVALMVAPPAAAQLLCERLEHMLAISVAIGCAAALSGFYLARLLDSSIAGSMAVMCGVLFLLAWLLAPQRGVLASLALRQQQRWDFAGRVLCIHLLQHEGTPEELSESAVQHMGEGLDWSPAFSSEALAHAQDAGLLVRRGDLLELTELGRETARETLGRA
ncbi:metal ABC transporter permease [bacterium]|nr:metal ABC transporter permease [bacterium]